MNLIQNIIGVKDIVPENMIVGIVGGYCEYNWLPAATPMIMDGNRLKKTGSAIASTYFPQCFTAAKINRYKVLPKNVLKIDSTGILDKKIKTVDRFDYGRLNRLSDYLSENIGIIFTIKSVDGVGDFLDGMPKFSECFKYFIPLGERISTTPSPIAGDTPMIILNFYRVNRALEAIGSKGAPGMAVETILCWRRALEEEHGLIASDSHFVVSQEERGVIQVDGEMIRERLCKINAMQEALTNTFLHMLQIKEGPVIKKKEATNRPFTTQFPTIRLQGTYTTTATATTAGTTIADWLSSSDSTE